MDVLIRFGFSIEDIKKITDSNNDINELDDKYISEVISILKSVGCSNLQIINIINTNPFCLNMKADEIKKVMAKLLDIGILNLNILLDSFPLILNMDYNELDNIYNNKKESGISQEEILNYFYYELFKDI